MLFNRGGLALKKLIFVALLVAFGTHSFARKTPLKPVEERVETLLSQMTLEEKLGQLQQLDGFVNGTYRVEHPAMVKQGLIGSTLNVRGAKITNELQHIAMDQSRLKIPVLFAFDVIHGYRTVFPVPLAESNTWDAELARKSAEVAALEASAVGLKWTFAPMVDIARDPRWGRIVEGAGEDPYLGSILARARVLGFQGTDPAASDRVMACAKHWVGYGAAEGGRDYNGVEISENTLREIYFPPFKAAVDAGVGTFMSAFNDINGVPASANPFTIHEVLKGEWAFKGLVVSDYESIKELVAHGLAADLSEAARYALNAGVDVEMVSTTYRDHVPQLIANNKVTMSVLDDSVRRVLRKKFELGLFEHPYVDETREALDLERSSSRKLAREISARSIVLLKNDTHILPLKKSLKSIAVIGPLANDAQAPLGSWLGDGRSEGVITALAGIRAKLPTTTTIRYIKGVDVDNTVNRLGKKTDEIAEAVAAAKLSEVVVMVLGESSDMSGEASSRSRLDLPGRQQELLKAVLATGTPVALVLMNGRPLALEWEVANVHSLVEAWFGGSEAGNGLADVLFGDVNPSGKLTTTFPRSVGQVPIYYNHKNTGRPADTTNKYSSKYIDLSSDPLFPFGFGLSYTKFELFDLKVDKAEIASGETLKVTVKITNLGAVTGSDVVQIYLRDYAASVTRPVKELKGFKRVTLNAGETQEVSFEMTYTDLGFYDRHMSYIVEPGLFSVIAGLNSAVGLETTFTAR